jgi:glycosyltransferase involved in cell wall biosynthesis
MKKLVSFIVPCYNQGQFLDEALQSVLGQTCLDWECIIVNDGSTDHTEEVAKRWVDKDGRFVYLQKENGGLSSARNAGLDFAKGDYVQFLDSDDCIVNTKLELSLQQLNLTKREGTKVAISNFRMFVDKPSHTSAPYCVLEEKFFNFESLLYQWEESFTIPIHCGLFESSLFKNFRFPENLKAKEDWVMWVNLFHKDCKAVFIDEPLALYRRNPNSMTVTKDMFPDFIKAYDYFRNYLSEEEYHQFSIRLISRYYSSNEDFKSRLNTVKNSNSYQMGLMIKKVLKTVGVLNIFKRFVIPIILKFKTK